MFRNTQTKPSKTQVITDIEFGSIPVIHKRNKHTITITIKAKDGILVSVPINAKTSEICDVIEKRRIWIRKHLATIYKKEKQKIIFNPDTDFKTKEHKLLLEKQPVKKILISVSNGIIRVIIPTSMEWETEGVQSAVKKAITEALRVEAHRFLPKLLLNFSKKHDFKVTGLNIKNMKTRWGSCSANGNINLNLNLMLLPDNLINHVVLHELCHTKHMNHGKNFKNLLQSLDPDFKRNVAELKNARIGVVYQ